ncbi:hypothetical protein BB559_002337 [Furculomyces boomerangus]|uniref:Uncharacterized protein n=2 Tax=Harpellales TaxID=61421 RepID=A0A2T9YW45_9FUNG|nr:hypothetical protein BB559_002337 [Furculomyces boomerangus]PVZ99414.1 hypothetical protein BB558_004569 [Smittium angustum]
MATKTSQNNSIQRNNITILSREQADTPKKNQQRNLIKNIQLSATKNITLTFQKQYPESKNQKHNDSSLNSKYRIRNGKKLDKVSPNAKKSPRNKRENSKRPPQSSSEDSSNTSSESNNESATNDNMNISRSTTTPSSNKKRSKQKPWKKQREISLNDETSSFEVVVLTKRDKNQNAPSNQKPQKGANSKQRKRSPIQIVPQATDNLSDHQDSQQQRSTFTTHNNILIDSAITFASPRNNSAKEKLYGTNTTNPIRVIPSQMLAQINGNKLNSSTPIKGGLIPKALVPFTESTQISQQTPTYSNTSNNKLSKSIRVVSPRSQLKNPNVFNHYAGAIFNNSSPDASSLPPPLFSQALSPSAGIIDNEPTLPPQNNYSQGEFPFISKNNYYNNPSAPNPHHSAHPARNLSSIFESLSTDSKPISGIFNRDSAIITSSNSLSAFQHSRLGQNRMNIEAPMRKAQVSYA